MRKVLISLAVVISVIMMSSLCMATEISGYADFHLVDAQNAVTTFDLSEVSVTLSTEIAKDKVDAEVELVADGAGGVDLGTAIISLKPVDNLTVSAGRFTIPFGIFTDSSDPADNPLISAPEIADASWDDIGLGASYAIAGVGAVDLYTINGDVVSQDQAIDNNNSKSVGLRISVSEALKGLNVGASFVTGRYALDAGGDGLSASGLGAHIVADIAELAGNTALPTLTLEYINLAVEPAVGDDQEESAFYVQLAATPVEKLEVAIRYNAYDDDADDSNTKTENTELSIGAAYTVYDNTELKIEYQINEEGDAYETNTDADDNNVLALGLNVAW
jgi:hypothetical protein